MRVLVAVTSAPIAAEAAIGLTGFQGTTALIVRVLGWATAVVAALALVVRPLLTQLAASRLDGEDLRVDLDDLRHDINFRSRVERALTQTESEPEAIRAALRAVTERQPDSDVTLLLAVPDEPRVGWTIRLVEDQLKPARPIPGTPGCAALAGNTTTCADSSSLEACAHLHDPTMEVCGTCIPMRLGDRVLGVLCVVRAPGEAPEGRTLQTLEWVAERTGVRVTEQRRLHSRSVASREDEVTGLPGPATMERHLRDSVRSLTPFCAGLIDIDDFVTLRDVHGDDEADDSLRLLADTLRLTLRPDDLICRLTGGRFGVILRNCAAPQASAAMERVREALVLSLSEDGSARFTFSAGIVESHRATSIEDLLEQARAAASAAHGCGGNRVTIAPE